MTIKIVLPKPTSDKDGVVAGWGTKVFNDKDSEIKNITGINLKIMPDEIVSATIDVAVSSNTDLSNIHALLGTNTMKEIADLHGYDLTLKVTPTLGNRSVIKGKIK